MDYSYTIFPEQRLIIEQYRGKATVAGLKESVHSLSIDPKFSADYDIIVDLRHCDFKFDPQDLEEFLGFHHKIYGISDSKTAMIVDNPRDTALSVLFKSYVEGARSIEVFSTLDAAKEWIQNS
ncbi:hypothetical protein [Prochlorothrix hollandica]|uniref:STAS/SEC14 domain-containing protein n=1 Tax=Prochlorothrix hollandica PCC 9006 = CALU 1027 TaxID=317619 RepID=A0A0M2PY68_PROHO|nr:hypothetical protein [Prochlorothrix hollandica]KKI99628.1 hypothetical protein PROH_06945 [Prochlorothrix hollandica PCC 9006 = CALU 1027]